MTPIVDLQQYTLLPLKVVHVAEKSLPDIIISTPHDGDVYVPLKKEHHSLFGSTTQTEVHAREIIGKILIIEEKAKEYLLQQWVDNNK